MSKYLLTASLDIGELDDLLELVNHQILEHTTLAKLKHLAKEMSDSEYEWHKGHAEYLKALKAKLKWVKAPAKKRKRGKHTCTSGGAPCKQCRKEKHGNNPFRGFDNAGSWGPNNRCD